MAGVVNVSVERLVALGAEIFEAFGVAPDDATPLARHFIRAEAQGNVSHGVVRILYRAKQFAAGKANPRPRIVFSEASGVVKAQADGGIGPLVAERMLERLVEPSRNQAVTLGIAAETGTMGALGVMARDIAERGMVGLILQRTDPFMSLNGVPSIGNNPFAFAAPLAGADPIVFDMANSVVARGVIEMSAKSGAPIPEGWALDARGEPTTDAAQALAGALLPAGAHKGLCMALMVECLTRGLAADLEPAASQRRWPLAVSALFVVVNPELCGATTYRETMARWSAEYVGKGGKIPGHAGAAKERESVARGVDLGPAGVNALREAATLAGLSPDIVPSS
ncbi:MAG: Ldh family oxidoreductase [Salinarimonadaceae bacterium]|nr:MAG: Ldh family oxidoreductase [Salinarimonadaceae bacterium]